MKNTLRWLTVGSLALCLNSTAQAQVTVIVDINETPEFIPSLTFPRGESFTPALSPPPASASVRLIDSLTEGCVEADDLTNEVTGSLQRVDNLGKAAAESGNSQQLIALTSEFNRLEGLLNAFIATEGEELVASPSPACGDLAASVNALIDEIRAYLDVLEEQLLSLIW